MIRKPRDLNCFICILNVFVDVKFPIRDIRRKITIFKAFLAHVVSSSVGRIGMNYRSHVLWTGAMRGSLFQWTCFFLLALLFGPSLRPCLTLLLHY